MNISAVLDLLGPGIRQIVEHEGCDIDMCGLMLFVGYSEEKTSLSFKLIYEYFEQDDYKSIEAYVRDTCSKLKTEAKEDGCNN